VCFTERPGESRAFLSSIAAGPESLFRERAFPQQGFAAAERIRVEPAFMPAFEPQKLTGFSHCGEMQTTLFLEL
jgi:hypothetical protein